MLGGGSGAGCELLPDSCRAAACCDGGISGNPSPHLSSISLMDNGLHQEYVASLIVFYKNNGTVSYVENNFLIIWPLYTVKTQLEK